MDEEAPAGESWINQVETWFDIITRQFIRRGTLLSGRVIVRGSATATATPDEILAKVELIQPDLRKLVDNNAK